MPDQILEKPETWKCQWVQTKRVPRKAGFLQPKDQKRGSQARQNLNSNCSTPVKHRKNYGPTSTSNGQRKAQTSNLASTCRSLATGVVSENTKQGAECHTRPAVTNPSSSTNAVGVETIWGAWTQLTLTRPPSHCLLRCCQRRPHGESELTPLHSSAQW